ncbi:MAG: hypothetical protein KIS89_02490 [Dokdonella sp.]|uniref:hypothetical protein n=1 Tax=Dokdonella sp. TaxID=2291710 RepID=UPI0027BB14B4|nr:hypothetical protein [Dokdonella sp.]MCW5577484.1 hypothetical protein [Dokdonella sp.]
MASAAVPWHPRHVGIRTGRYATQAPSPCVIAEVSHAKARRETDVVGTREAKRDDFPPRNRSGLHLIRRGGKLHQRWNCTRPDGRKNRLAPGQHSDMDPEDDRACCVEYRRLPAAGTDPAALRAAARVTRQQTLAQVAAHWLAIKSSGRAEPQ